MPKSNKYWWATFAVTAVAGTLAVKGSYAISLIHLVAIAALLAASMRFVLLIGELSFASSAFVGIGAYGAGIATTLLDWPFAVALLVGPLMALVVSSLFGLVTLRIKGPYFMLIGFAFSEAVRIMFTKTALIGGVSGMTGIFPPRAMDPWMPAFVVAIVCVLVFALYAIEKSDFGKVLCAIRDNEQIARTVGLNVLHFKVACFAIASFCAGVVGSLMAFVNNVISPGDFSFLLASFALAYVKVGGESSIYGSVTGAIVLTLLGSYALGLGAGEHLFYGGAIVVAMLMLPGGLSEVMAKFWRRMQPAPLRNSSPVSTKTIDG